MEQFNNQKIAILGSTGLFGSSFIEKLRYSRIPFIEIGRRDGEFKINLDEEDIGLRELKKFNINYFINLAAETNVDLCEKEKKKCFEANFLLVKKLSEFIKINFKNSIFIHFSTDQVYWGSGPHKEKNASFGNYYSECKLMGEKEAKKINSIILRTNFFGKSNVSKKSFTDWIYSSAKSKEKINLYKDVFFNPLSIDTLQNILMYILKHPVLGTYNLGSRGGLSKAEFARKFLKKLHIEIDAKDVNFSTIQNKAPRPLDMRMNCDLFEKKFKTTLPCLEDEIDKIIPRYI